MKQRVTAASLAVVCAIGSLPAIAQQAPSREEIAKRSGMIQSALDADGDKVLSAQEIAAAPDVLKSMDQNGDGVLSPDESHGGRFPMYHVVRENWVFNIIDDDGDVVISAEEISMASEMLARLEIDGDGQLAGKELAPPPGPPPSFFGRPPDPKKIAAFTASFYQREYEAVTGPVPPGADDRAYNGYLFFHGSYDNGRRQVQPHTYLMDMSGNFVHEWKNERYAPEGVSAYLLDNGLVARTTASLDWKALGNFPVGANGVVELVDWDGNIVWEFEYCEIGKYCLHHDFAVLPDGNIMAIVYDVNTVEEATAFGWRGKPSPRDTIFTERLIEIAPNLDTGGSEIVWEWDSRDHLVQDVDDSLDSFGVVSENKTRIDPNYDRIDRLFVNGQLFHFNSVDYNADLKQLVVSSATFGEVWLINHDTTTEEAKGPAGELLYRWGSPRTYGGPDEDTVLFWQHDAYWVPGTHEVQIFNNGGLRAADGSHNPNELFMGVLDGGYSDVVRVKMPVDDAGHWDWSQETDITWSYNSDGSKGLHAPFMSGARKLPNGNVLMVQAQNNRALEVTEAGETVLDFTIPKPGRIFRLYKYSPDHPALAGKF